MTPAVGMVAVSAARRTDGAVQRYRLPYRLDLDIPEHP
jgi:hypothetical protein